MHGLDLLLSLGTSVVKSLILLLNQFNLTLYFFLPSVLVRLLSLLVFGFEFSNLAHFSLFLNFKNGLL